MSRLIRSDAAAKPAANTAPEITAPLDRASATQYIKGCLKIALTHAEQAFESYLQALDNALSETLDTARSNHEFTEISGIQRLVRRNGTELARYFTEYIVDTFTRFQKGELMTQVQGGGEQDGGGLSLVDNDVLEETIAITTMTQKLDVYFAEALWALNRRMTLLNGGTAVVEASNPLAPVQACEALRRALRLVTLTSKTKHLAYQAFEEPLVQMMRSALDDCNQYLQSVGILTGLRYQPPLLHQPVQSVGSDSSSPEKVARRRRASDKYQTSLLQAIRGLQQASGGHAGAAGQVSAGSASGHLLNGLLHSAGDGSVPNGTAANIVIDENQIRGVLEILQQRNQQAVFAEPQSLTPVTMQEVLKGLAEGLASKNPGTQARVSEDNMNTIDLVGLLFEYMLKDENLPDSVKTLLSYLHTPFLKLAFNDPGFFEQHEHPARLLLNSLAEAGTRWIGNDGTVQHDMYNRIKQVVERVLREFKNDVRVITELMLEFNTQNKNIIRKQELLEKRAAEKARGEERLREVKLRVNREIRARLDGRELPAAVLLFALQPWSDFLSFTLLRYSDQSERWAQALQLVDDLLWSIEHRDKPEDINLQRMLAIRLAEDMQGAFETIGYDQVKGKKIIDAIVALIQSAINRQKVEPAPAPMRDELEKQAAAKAGHQMEPERKLTEEEFKVVESLKMIEFGSWFEFEGGKRLKLAWYNARTSQYMFLDQTGKTADMKSGREIAREMIAKRAKIIAGSSKPFFERALENIFQKLKAQAEAQTDIQERTDGGK